MSSSSRPRHKCGLTYTLALACLLAPLAGRAQERPLTLDEALQLARQNNRDLHAAGARLQESRSGVEQAIAGLMPTISAGGTYTYNYRNVTFGDLINTSSFNSLAASLPAPFGTDIASSFGGLFGGLSNVTVLKQNALQGTLSANVPLIVPSAYAALDAARKTYDASKANFQVSETFILFSAAQAFYAAAGTDELLRARTDAIRVAEVTLKNAEVRFQAGTVNRTEVTRAELALLNAQQAARLAQDTRDQAYRALATVLVLREPFRVTPPEPSIAPRQEPSVEALSSEALRLRPEFAAYDSNVQAAQSQIIADGLRWLPNVSGFFNASDFNYAGFTGDKYSWALGLQLSWAIYDGGYRDAARHQAEAQKIELEDQLSELHDTIHDDIANAAQALVTQRTNLATAIQSVSLAKETLTLIRDQYDAGTATELDVLQAQDELVGAEVQLAQARFDLALADLALQRNAGTFPAEK